MEYDDQWLRGALERFFERYTKKTGESRDKLLKRARADGTIRDFLANRPTRTGGDRGPPQWDVLTRVASAAGTNVFDMLRPPTRGPAKAADQAAPDQIPFDQASLEKIIAVFFDRAREIRSTMTGEQFSGGIGSVYLEFVRKKRREDPKADAKEYASNVVPFIINR